MENEITENTVDTNVTTENNVNNTVDENLAVDDIAVALDYYDRYYTEMLNKTDNMISKQEIIINNQYEQQEANKQFQKTFGVIVFLIGLFFIYFYMRNMLKRN